MACVADTFDDVKECGSSTAGGFSGRAAIPPH